MFSESNKPERLRSKARVLISHSTGAQRPILDWLFHPFFSEESQLILQSHSA